MLFTSPEPDDRELEVLADVEDLKQRLRHQLHEPHRWYGSLRRLSEARQIQGSNTIEGYDASLDDAAAIAAGEEPLDADEETRRALSGYHEAMTYVLQLAADEDFAYSAQLVKSLHFMMTSYDLQNRPGRWRLGDIYVRKDETGEIVYQGPDADEVPSLVSELMTCLNDPVPEDQRLIQAGMAHLNLVMIHPFRDGNGRMARALATLVLTRSDIGEPEFSSIEEWLGANTDDYYSVLAHTGHGSWQPRDDAHLWLTFNLRAHHMQAQTVARRVGEAGETWTDLDRLLTEHNLPERTMEAMFDAVLGYRVRRAGYLKRAEVTEQTATRDLAALASAGILTAYGNGRGRYYAAGEPLKQIQERRRARRKPLRDPYPWMRAKLSEPTA